MCVVREFNSFLDYKILHLYVNHLEILTYINDTISFVYLLFPLIKFFCCLKHTHTHTKDGFTIQSKQPHLEDDSHKDLTQSINIQLASRCCLCKNSVDSYVHLFFTCTFAKLLCLLIPSGSGSIGPNDFFNLVDLESPLFQLQPCC